MIAFDPVRVLRDARALIDTPEKWATSAWARAADGLAVDIGSGEACAFCAESAITRATINMRGVAISAWRAHDFLRDAIGAADIPGWNDEPGRTHQEVLAAFDMAIAKAEALRVQ